MKYEKGTFVIVPNKKALEGQPATLQALFMWICSYADENGQCFPGRRKLAKNIAVGVDTIDRHIKTLEELGFLTKEKRKEGAKNLANLYQIMIVEGVAAPQDQPHHKTRVAAPQDQGSRISGARGSRTTPTLTISSITNTNELNPDNSLDASPSFDQFWSAYPNKELKKKTREIWGRKNLAQHLNDILKFIEMAKLTDRWQRGFIKQPPAFLNGECWNDDLTSYGLKNKAPLPTGTPYTPGKYKDNEGDVFIIKKQ